MSFLRSSDLWFILEVSRILGATPVPYQTWLYWLHLHGPRLEKSKQATYPFPDGVLT